MKHSLARLARGAAAAAILLSLAACATVSPYEREDLTRPGMDTKHESGEATFAAHVHDSREGATGGTTSAGGGCGCN